MQYFNEEFNTFMAGVALNNEKSWFDANRKTYEEEVKKPFAHFLDDLITAIRKFDDIDDLPLNKFMFRINRDVRFAKDKRPYNPWVSAAIVRGGKKDPWPGYYIRLGVDGMDLGGGMHHPEKDQLTSVRRYTSRHGSELHKLLADKDFKKYFGGELQGDKNKVLPAEFKQAAADEPLIANKGWHYWHTYTADDIVRDDLLDFVVKHFKSASKVNDYFKKALR